MNAGKTESTVRVIIVSTDDREWLTQCLDALEDSQFRGFKAAIVANCCSDGSADIARTHDFVDRVYESDRRLGFASANNLALRDCAEDFVFLLNPDTKVHPEAVGVMVDFLSEEPSYGIVGCWQAQYSGEWLDANVWTQEVIQEASDAGRDWVRLGSATVLEHYYVQGAAMMMRGSVIKQIGVLDAIYRTFYEETDFCRRAIYADHKVGLLREAIVKHQGGGNWQRTRRRRWQRDWLMLRNELLFTLTGYPGPRIFTGALRILARQFGDVILRRKSYTIPVIVMPLLLANLLMLWKRAVRMRRRNQLIAEGRGIPESLRCIE